MKLEGFLIFEIWNLEFSPQKKKKKWNLKDLTWQK